MTSPPARRSLLFKLTALSACAAIASLLAIGIFIHEFSESSRQQHWHRIHPLARVFADALAAENSATIIRRLSQETHLSVRYRDKAQEFSTTPDFPTFSELRRHPQKRFSHRRPHRIPKELIFAHAGDEHWYLLLRHQTKQLAVALEFDDDGNDELPPLGLALIAALSLIWGVLYIFNRRQLLPLLRLREDMAQIGHGKWKQLEVNRTDEIGLLANEFNNMQTRLQAMLNARERFLIDASHELRSPITRLKVTAEFIENAKISERIKNDLQELETLTTNILQNARLTSDHAGVNKQPVAAAAWLRKILATYPPEQAARLSAHSDDNDTLHIDEKQMTAALHNLLDNALKYAPTATVTISRSDPAHDQILVSDDGDGIAEKDLPHLFEPFYRADESRTRGTGGFGLGLSIVERTVKAHGGHITAENRDGLQIRIRLPAIPARQ